MNKTLKNILELCENEDLNITTFVSEPCEHGHKITLELECDERAKNIKCGSGIPGEITKI